MAVKDARTNKEMVGREHISFWTTDELAEAWEQSSPVGIYVSSWKAQKILQLSKTPPW